MSLSPVLDLGSTLLLHFPWQLGGCSVEASALVKGISRGLDRGIFEIAGSGLS